MLGLTEAPESFPWYWLVVGFAGQALFASRFVVQWVASERARRSVFPMAFWYLSIIGSLVLLTYAIRRGDPVFIVGQATGFLAYVRNVYFRRLEAEQETP